MLVYRLENKEGVGPFHTEQGEMAQELEPHTAPRCLEVLHYAGLSKSKFNNLSEAGFVFGWNSRDKMINFFTDNNKASLVANALGFRISVYSSSEHYLFADGQVFFLRLQPPIRKFTLKDFFNESK